MIRILHLKTVVYVVKSGDSYLRPDGEWGSLRKAQRFSSKRAGEMAYNTPANERPEYYNTKYYPRPEIVNVDDIYVEEEEAWGWKPTAESNDINFHVNILLTLKGHHTPNH